jgi:hypothetical protein
LEEKSCPVAFRSLPGCCPVAALSLLGRCPVVARSLPGRCPVAAWPLVDELVILAAVPGSKGDDVKGGLRIDGVVEGARLVVEQLGGVHRESRDGGGVDQELVELERGTR